jgi:hypothetical protein
MHAQYAANHAAVVNVKNVDVRLVSQRWGDKRPSGLAAIAAMMTSRDDGGISPIAAISATA